MVVRTPKKLSAQDAVLDVKSGYATEIWWLVAYGKTSFD